MFISVFMLVILPDGKFKVKSFYFYLYFWIYACIIGNMPLTLRPHQQDFIEDIRSAFRKHRSVLAQAPVGFGKTIVAAFMGKRILEKNNSMFFCVPTKDLLTQTYRAFAKFNIPHGIIAADYVPNKGKIQI